MQPLIKSRSLVQIRTHAQKVFKKIGLKKAFLMGGNKKAKTSAVNVNRDGDAAPQRVIYFLLRSIEFIYILVDH